MTAAEKESKTKALDSLKDKYFQGWVRQAIFDTLVALLKNFKKRDPYKEAYNEVHLMQVDDKLAEVLNYQGH